MRHRAWGLRALAKRKCPFLLLRCFRALRDNFHPRELFGRILAGGVSSQIHRTAVSNAWRCVSVGRRAVIAHNVTLHVNRRGNKRQIVIGEEAYIGPNCFFSSGERIVVGAYALIGPSCHFLGAGHSYENPFIPYSRSAVKSYGTLTLETSCWIGADVLVIGSVRVGFGSIVAAGSVVRSDVLPLSVVVGNKGRVVRLFDLESGVWRQVPSDEKEYEEVLREHKRRLPSEIEFYRRLNV